MDTIEGDAEAKNRQLGEDWMKAKQELVSVVGNKLERQGRELANLAKEMFSS